MVAPRAELVTTGAVSTAVFTGLGVLALLLVFLLDNRGDVSEPTRLGIILVATAEFLAALWYADLSGWGLAATIVWTLLLGILGSSAVGSLAVVIRELPRRARAKRELQAALDVHREAAEREAGADDALAFWRAHPQHQRASDSPSGQPESEAPTPGSAFENDLVKARLDRVRSEGRLRRALSEAVSETVADPQEAANLMDACRRLPDGPLKKLADDVLEGRRLETRASARLSSQILGVLQFLRHPRHGPPLVVALILAGVAIILAESVDGDYWVFPLLAIPLALAWTGTLGLVTVGLVAVGLAALLGFEETRWLAGMFAVVLALALSLLGVARATAKFAWYGVAVFLSVPLYGGILVGTNTVRSPDLQPAALIRKGDDLAICGIYVTETDKRIYMGHIQVDETGDHAEPDTGRIFWIRTEDVDLVTVGALQPLDDVNQRARKLLEELYAERGQEHPATLKPVTRQRERGKEPNTRTTTRETPAQRQRPRLKEPPSELRSDCNMVDVNDSALDQPRLPVP